LPENSAPEDSRSRGPLLFLLAAIGLVAGGLLRPILPFWVWIVLLLVALFAWTKRQGQRPD
jgi:hypothetical protein